MRRLVAALALVASLTGCFDSKPAALPTTVLIVRHGESWKNVKAPDGMTPEQQDALTPLGREQIAAVASLVVGKGVTTIYCSPTGRTRETAAIVGAAVHVTPTVEPALASPAPAVNFVKSLHGEGRIVVVTHGDVIPEILGEAAGTPPAERAKKHSVATGSLSEVVLSPDGSMRIVSPAGR